MTTVTPEPSLSTAPDGEVGEVSQPYRAEPLATTLDRVVAFNRRFVHHELDSTHDLIAVWVAHTFAMPVWDYTPRIYITAPQPGVGKTKQATVAALLCPDSVEASSVSGPGLFREISARQPVVFLDEAENQWSPGGGRDKEIVTAVVNRGYEPDGFVIRSEGNAAVRHSVYAAVAIVGVDNGLLPETTRSRAIPVRMTPGGGRAERFRRRQHAEFADEIRLHLSAAAMDYRVMDSGLDDRDADLWESLYAVADSAGGDWPARIRTAHQEHQWDQSVSQARLTLEVVQRYFKENKTDRVSAAALAAYLTAEDALPVITPKGLHKVMSGYRVAPRKTNGVSTYYRGSFTHVFDVWLREGQAEALSH